MAESNRRRFSALHALGRTVLAEFGVQGAQLKLLRHEHNTTFRVDAAGDRFVLRVNRPGVHNAATIDSEMQWLAALVRDTDAGVPIPIQTTDGRFVATVEDPSSGAVRHGVLLRWQAGRFVSAGLKPNHLRAVARLQATLHRHAAVWAPPAGFLRPRVDTLTNAGKVASIASGPTPGVRPSAADIARAVALVGELMGAEAVAVAQDAIAEAVQTTSAVEAMEGPSGLIHADLHYENFLFERGVARAIDFDDCGWGSRLYDLSITLWELQDRNDYPALRDAFLAEYTSHLSIAEDHETLIAGLIQLRRVQILLWVLESRHHPAFADEWRESSAEELDAIRRALAS